jgi:hypothetical protein
MSSFVLEAQLKPLWEYKHEKRAVARSVHFLNAGRHLLILFLESHEACVVSCLMIF